ncbi:unnamed protein product [Bursaphelenchus okinawaensis]|uniref:Large ribosomal subunit protein mL45 n=1 Tax=Bursaphelenchus okinawaensis TaxID=465554 RepID=A0A811KI65_9BILA|nr:unnamed protein product [Bursaphelenchus okinawaensis]CAG9103327.1 unnamed protein product [Bursaphelenchus okinawaensis]
MSSLASRLGLLTLSNPSVLACSVIQERNVHHHMERGNLKRYLGIGRSNTAKANRNTHINEKKFRQLRGRKNIPVELPDYQLLSKAKDMYPDELRVAMLKQGMNSNKDVASRQWNEAQLTLNSFGLAMDNYIPPEDPLPIFPEMNQPVSGAKAKFSEVQERVKHRWFNYFNGMRIIKKKEGMQKFNKKEFAKTAEQIYVDTFEALSKRDKVKLLNLITEHCFEKMWPDVSARSLQWEFVEFSQPSEVIAVRAGDFPYKSGNHIAQITVKMYPVIKRAIYDRFGRILVGNPDEVKSNVEYVLFENHISNLDGKWRIHDKVYPSWATVKDKIERPNLLKKAEEEQDDIDRPEKPAKFKLGIEDTLRKQMKEHKEKEEDGLA